MLLLKAQRKAKVIINQNSKNYDTFNLHIKLSIGKSLIYVSDSSRSPEQGYIVERLFLPLLSLDNRKHELEMLKEHRTMDERRINEEYCYLIDLTNKEVKIFEEHYSYTKDTFRKDKDITKRYNEYLKTIS